MIQPRRRSLSRLLRALVRDWLLLLREFWWPLVGLLIAILLVALIFQRFYGNDQIPQGSLTFDEAIYLAVTLTTLEAGYLPPADNHWLILFYFLMPLVGIIFAGQGLLNFFTLLFNRQARGQAWLAAQVSTMSEHYVVCGLGRVGSLVVRDLTAAGADVVGLERDLTKTTVQRLIREGQIVIEGDGRQLEILKMAGVERATAAILCTDDDLANLEAALHCRDLNPAIRLIVRMFDHDLAKQVTHTLGIHAAMSSSALAAPIFAGAAMDLDVEQSFYIGDRVMSVARLDVMPKSRLVGMTVSDIVTAHEVSIIAHERDGVQNLHPANTTRLAAGDAVVALADVPTLTTLAAMNHSKRPRVELLRSRLPRRPIVKP